MAGTTGYDFLNSVNGLFVEPAGLETSADDLVELLLEKRQAARKEREFALSDQIRDGLAALGVRVEDVRDGYRWRFER